MGDSEKIVIELSSEELSILIFALSNSQPVSKDFEVAQFKLYHKLLFKLNEKK